MSDGQKTPYLIIGCGYTGTRLAQALRADGVPVRACSRRVALLGPLADLGVDVHYLDAGKTRLFGPILRGLTRPVVVYSVPAVPMLPVGEAVRRAADAALQANASAFIYLSTTGVYGRNELSENDEWVDEDSAVDIHDPDMTSRLADEAAVSASSQAGLRTVILRLSAIYGPGLYPGQAGRGVRQRLRQGQYKLWDGGRYYFSRIHVDDLVAVIRAAGERAPAGSLYVVGDDHPCPQGEYGRWLAAHLGLPEPPTLDSLRAEAPRQVIRGRRIRNQRMKQALGISLRYPTYREGELQIDAYEGLVTPAADAQAASAARPNADQAAATAEVPAPVPQAPAASASAPGDGPPAQASGDDRAAQAPGDDRAAQAPSDDRAAQAPGDGQPAQAPSAAAASPANAPQTLPTWPFHLGRTGDLGAQLGLSSLHASSLLLAPGASLPAGRVYAVLSGTPVASTGGRLTRLAPLDLVPPDTSLHNPEGAPPALLLAFDAEFDRKPRQTPAAG